MSISTTYTCDRCAESSDSPHRLYEVQVVARQVNDHNHYNTEQTDKVHWCRSCLIELHVKYARHDEPKPTTPAPTIEELVRQIVKEETGG